MYGNLVSNHRQTLIKMKFWKDNREIICLKINKVLSLTVIQDNGKKMTMNISSVTNKSYVLSSNRNS